MALKVGITNNGNWSTAAVWDNVSNTPTLHASTNITLAAASDTEYTPAFTAPAVDATCAATGVALFFATISTVGTITVTLQENPASWADVGGGSCTASINCATIYAALGTTTVNNYIYFRVGTPFVFDNATAGRYRWKIALTGATGNTTLGADNSSTTLASFWSTNVVASPAIPGATDDVLIVGQGDSTAIKIIVDDTSRACGSSSNTTACTAMRPTTSGQWWGVQIGYGGTLAWATGASATLELSGCLAVGAGGTWRIDGDGAGAALGASYVATLALIPSTSADFGIGIFDKSTVVLQGTPKSSTTLYKTHPASTWSVGATSGDTADNVDWTNGDEIIIGPTGAYNHTEYKTVTKTDANTYSWTGGLSYDHTTDAWLLNISRNIVIRTEDGSGNSATTKGMYLYNANTTDGGVNIDWVRFENVGSTATNKVGIQFENTATQVADVDYSVCYNIIGRGFLSAVSTVSNTHTGLIACKNTGTAGTYGLRWGQSKNKTLSYLFAFDTYTAGYNFDQMAGVNLSNIYAIACNQSGNTAIGGIYIGGISNCTFNNVECHLNRYYGISTYSGFTFTTFNNVLVGTKGKNTTADIRLASDSYINSVIFNDSSFGSDIFVSNYTGMVVGSEMAFHNYNSTVMKHYVYTPTGIYQSCGASLDITTVKTASSYGVAMLPDATYGSSGLPWAFYIYAKAGEIVTCYGFLKRIAASSTTPAVTVSLYLPGSTTADATDTIAAGTADDTAWLDWLVSAAYTGSVDSLAKVTITVTGVLGYAIIDDIYNGTNALGALDVWYDGKPAPIIYDQLGDAGAVWSSVVEGTHTAGDLLRIILAAVAGKSDTIPGGPVNVRDVADSKNRITATVDAQGNRTAITTLDGTV